MTIGAQHEAPSPWDSFSSLALSIATTCASVSTKLSWARLDPLLHRLQVVAQPHAATPAGETTSPRLRSSLATRAWPKAGCSIASAHNGVLDWFFNTGFLRLISAVPARPRLVDLLEPVEAVAAVTHHLASLADVAELLGELQQSNLAVDDLLFGGHRVLQVAEAGRFATPTAPRPASACDSPWG